MAARFDQYGAVGARRQNQPGKRATRQGMPPHILVPAQRLRSPDRRRGFLTPFTACSLLIRPMISPVSAVTGFIGNMAFQLVDESSPPLANAGSVRPKRFAVLEIAGPKHW
jgi:hypothetical protein